MRSALEPKPGVKPGVSRSSILILSGVLIGYFAQIPLPGALRLSILGAGVVGLLAFLGLDFAAQRRNQAHQQLARERLDWMLTARIHRHIPKLHPHAVAEETPEFEHSSFVAVVTRRMNQRPGL